MQVTSQSDHKQRSLLVDSDGALIVASSGGSAPSAAAIGAAVAALTTDVAQAPTTSTLSNVSGSTSNATLLASNSSRKGAVFVNDSTAILYLKFGTTASTTSYTFKLVTDAVLTLKDGDYKGRIDGIWDGTNGACRVTELT